MFTQNEKAILDEKTKIQEGLLNNLKAEIKELKEWNDNLEKTAVNQYIEIQELKKENAELKDNFEFAKKQIVLKHEEIKELKKINN